jgi:multisubunit Na+/H+ antiporter MnhB subunit
MANHVLKSEVLYREVRVSERPASAVLDRASAAFGLSAAVAVIFNTLLAWIKDAYEPLNAFMAHLTGHHWTTHGLADVILFLVLGAVFMNTGVAERMSARKLIETLIASVVVSGLGLLLWFVFV